MEIRGARLAQSDSIPSANRDIRDKIPNKDPLRSITNLLDMDQWSD